MMAYMKMGLVLRLEARPVDGQLQQGVDQAGIQSDLQYDALAKREGEGEEEEGGSLREPMVTDGLGN